MGMYLYRKCDMGERDFAMWQLQKMANRLHRMVTPKRLYRPLIKGVKWGPPSPSLYRGYVMRCADCKRECQGIHCRECWNKRQWRTYRTKRAADNRRLALVQMCFNNVIQRKEYQMSKGKTVVAPIVRSTSGLREVIFEEMEALRNGDSSPQRARSMAAMANSILQSVEVEIEYHKYVSSNRRPTQVDGEKKVVELGTDIKLVAAA